jgi:hypothetical protein
MRGGHWLWGRPFGVTGIAIAAVYVVFGIADLMFSLQAFTLGVGEVNPAMAWLAQHDLFIPAKVALTALVAVLIAWVYPRGASRPVAWGVLTLMAVVNVYHVWGLNVL